MIISLTHHTLWLTYIEHNSIITRIILGVSIINPLFNCSAFLSEWLSLSYSGVGVIYTISLLMTVVVGGWRWFCSVFLLMTAYSLLLIVLLTCSNYVLMPISPWWQLGLWFRWFILLFSAPSFFMSGLCLNGPQFLELKIHTFM